MFVYLFGHAQRRVREAEELVQPRVSGIQRNPARWLILSPARKPGTVAAAISACNS